MKCRQALSREQTLAENGYQAGFATASGTHALLPRKLDACRSNRQVRLVFRSFRSGRGVLKVLCAAALAGLAAARGSTSAGCAFSAAPP